MFSYALYLSPLISSFLTASAKKEFRIFGFLLTASLMLLLLILRDGVGFDYISYKENFYNTPPNWEPLFLLIYRFAQIFDSHIMLFAVMAVITVLPVCYVAYKRDNLWLLWLYIALPQFYVETFGIIRQSCAVSFCILAYHYYADTKKIWPFFLLIAIGFHYSAIGFGLFLLFLNKNVRGSKVFLLLFVFLLLIYRHDLVSALTPIFPKLAFYNGDNVYGFKQVILNFIISSIFMLNLKIRDAKYIVLIGLVLSVPLMTIDSVLLRFITYFLIPLLFVELHSKEIFERVHVLAVICITTLSYITILYIRGYQQQYPGSMIPYLSILH